MESELSSRPSFFEVYASQHLNGTLRPAVRFLLEVLSVRNPRLITASAWSDEIFSAVLLVLEISQLRKGSALLAESFYSLRRSVNSSFKPNLTLQKPLSGSQVICSVFFAVLVPYVKAKLDNWYENATGGAAAALFPDQLPPDSDHSADSPYQPFLQSLSIHNHSERSSFLHHLLQSPQLLAKLVTALQRYLKNPSLRKRALALYPHICLVFEGINLLFSILYLYDFSNYFTLPLALQRLVLRRVGAHDLLGIVSLTTNGAQMQLNTGAWNIWSTVTEKLLDLLKAAFFASIFGFRFLQYYYATEVSYSI